MTSKQWPPITGDVVSEGDFDLEAARLATSLMAEQLLRNRAEEEERQKALMTQRLLDFAELLHPLGVGSVVTWEKLFPSSQKMYYWAAILTDMGWSMTGRRTSLHTNQAFVSILVGYGLHAADVTVVKQTERLIELTYPIFELQIDERHEDD